MKLLLRIFVCSYIGHNDEPTGRRIRSSKNWGPGMWAPIIVTPWACQRCGTATTESWQWEVETETPTPEEPVSRGGVDDRARAVSERPESSPISMTAPPGGPSPQVLVRRREDGTFDIRPGGGHA